jgi:hypothetical protein
MLIIPRAVQEANDREARQGLTDHFNLQMEKILNDNSSVDQYWILGKAKTEKVLGKTIVRPFLQACMEKPSLIRETFVYEVDNKRGVKTLLWVMHPDDTLTFPTLGKSIRPRAEKSSLILPPK